MSVIFYWIWHFDSLISNRSERRALGILGIRGIVGLLLGEDGVDDVRELSRHGYEGLPVGLALAPLLQVVVVHRRLQLQLGHGRQVQRPPQVGRALLGDVVDLALEGARLVLRWADAGVLHYRGGVLEPTGVPDLGDDLGSELVGDARYREDERLHLIEQDPDLGLDLGHLSFYELDLLGQELDLEGERAAGERDAAGALGGLLDLPRLVAAELPMAGPVQQVGQRSDVDGCGLLGGRAPLQERLGGLAEHVGEQLAVLGEYLVKGGDDLALQVSDALRHGLMQARHLPQRDQPLVGERARLEASEPQGLGYYLAVDRVRLDLAEVLEPAHRVGLDRVDHGDIVAGVPEGAEARQPVVAGRLHPDEDARGVLAEPLQVGDASFQPVGGVLELHRLGQRPARLVDRPDDVVVLRDVDSSVDHGCLRGVAAGSCSSVRAHYLLEETRGGRRAAPSSSLSVDCPGRGRLSPSFARSLSQAPCGHACLAGQCITF